MMMGISLIFLVTVMWSLVGIMVKTAYTMVDSFTITFGRFFFGVLFLAALLIFKGSKIKVHWKSWWIWVGALGKSANYIFENLGISLGYSYGNIMVMPIISIFSLLASALYFKERISRKSWLAMIFCVVGIMLVIWNGLPLSEILDTSLFTTLLFVLSGIGAGFHFLSQKVLIDSMDSGNMNFSVFLFASLFTAAPLPATFKIQGPFNLWALLSLILLGFITGITFYIYANALRRVPFVIASILGNASALFTLLWSWLFFQEPITSYIITGVCIFLFGVILLNIPDEILFKGNRILKHKNLEK